MQRFIKYVQENIRKQIDKFILLGDLKLRIVSDVLDFKVLDYFDKTIVTPYEKQFVDFELWCIADENFTQQDVSLYSENTYRSNSFLDGYYATDHFGEPACFLRNGNTYFLFAKNFECIVWPYFIKYFLMLNTINNNSLHIKSAAVRWKDYATLLVGRGGAGKTFFLIQLCQAGADFITNSHAIIKDGKVTGVLSSMRLRPNDSLCYNFLEHIDKATAIKHNELIVNPCDIFDVVKNDRTKIKNIFFLNYEAKSHKIEKMNSKEAYNYAEQFSLGINVYRLEEDLLDFYRGNYRKFSMFYGRMKEQLLSLIEKSNCYFISSDITVDKNRKDILEIL